MNRTLRIAVAAASLAMLGAAAPATAQTDPHQHEQATPGAGPQGMGGMGMGGMMGGQDMGGMMRMMQGCPMMQGGGHGLPHLPPGNEKLELQMHADMMKAMGDILAKYAARLPEKK
jgi:hypothetical protein